jgi:hypothetical protein
LVGVERTIVLLERNDEDEEEGTGMEVRSEKGGFTTPRPPPLTLTPWKGFPVPYEGVVWKGFPGARGRGFLVSGF